MPDVNKAGWRTSEFWMGLLAAVVSYYIANPQTETELETKILGIAAVVLSYLGYTVSRTKVKQSQNDLASKTING